MKTKILLYFSFLSITSFAQHNRSLIDTSKIWQNLESCQWSAEPYINNYFIKTGTDTVLNSHIYKKVYYSKSENFDTVDVVGFIRENNKKIYFLEKSNLKEGLLYDFNISVGEQVSIQNYYLNNSIKNLLLKEIVTIDIDGERIQKYIFQNTEEYWLEGIGSILGILNSGGFGDTISCSYELICFKENIMTYINPKHNDCDLTGTSHIKQELNSKKYNTYPNLIDNRLIVFSLGEKIFYVEIFDISGKRVYSQLHGNTIDASRFSKGLYLVKVYDLNKQVSVFKIIKQ